MRAEEQDLLARAIEARDVELVGPLLDNMVQTFAFDAGNGSISAFCEAGLLVARFPLPGAVDATAFAVALGLVD